MTLRDIDLKYVNGALVSGKSMRVGSAPNASSNLPAGYGGSATATGLSISSSYAGGDDDGTGTDSTGRLNLYSYQRANNYSFGENIRHFIMRSDAKTMQAFYIPVQTSNSKGGYDATLRDPLASGINWKPVVWQGAHYEANDHGSIHGHWELEVADSTGALQGRLEIPFIDQSKLSNGIDTTTIGLDYTNIRTNQADFSVRAQNITTGDYAGQTTCLRVGGGNDKVKDIRLSISSDMLASGDRWKIRANTDTESGSNAGTNFQIIRCADDGTQLGTPLFIQRSDGQITNGAPSAKSARWAAAWGTSGIHGFSAQPSATIGSAAAFDAVMSANTERAFQANVTGDANRRFVVFADGKTEWGDGTASRDVNLYRSAAGTLATDFSLTVGGTFRAPTMRGSISASGTLTLQSTSNATKGTINIGSSQWNDGTNVILVANTTAAPASNPVGGGYLYVESGALKFRGSSGTVTVIAPA
ncbi:hypothetical protein ACWDA7_14130 [Streptomyces sp. NPDC001156]